MLRNEIRTTIGPAMKRKSFGAPETHMNARKSRPAPIVSGGKILRFRPAFRLSKKNKADPIPIAAQSTMK
jgi:hypothetical protein